MCPLIVASVATLSGPVNFGRYVARNRSGAMAEGQIILLNGTSSAGKSTLPINFKFFLA